LIGLHLSNKLKTADIYSDVAGCWEQKLTGISIIYVLNSDGSYKRKSSSFFGIPLIQEETGRYEIQGDYISFFPIGSDVPRPTPFSYINGKLLMGWNEYQPCS
jgi:hypothetical protein